MRFNKISNGFISFFRTFYQNTCHKREQSPDYNDLIENGQNFLKNKNYSHAVSIYKKCIRLFPDKAGGYNGMSTCAHQTWQREKAVFWLDRSIEKTDDASSYKIKARFLVNHGHYDEGIGIMDDVLKKFGHTEQNLIFNARLLFIPKRYLEAAQILKGLQLNFETQSLLARALIGANANEEADSVIKTLDQWPVYNKEDVKIQNLLKCWQKNYLNGAGYNQPKIFCVGLSRTATTSLSIALEILGFGALHFNNPLTNQIISKEDFKYFDALSDSPVSYRFEELYKLYPNAKFIYTERDIKDWVASSSRLYRPWGVKTTVEFRKWLDKTNGGKYEKLYHNLDPIYQKAYCSLYADFPDWETAYVAFDQRVKLFFDSKPAEKLLKLNICKSPEWEKLCHFLEVPIPEVPFPHANTVVVRDKAVPGF